MEVRELIKSLMDFNMDDEVKFVNVGNKGFEINHIEQSSITNIIWLKSTE